METQHNIQQVLQDSNIPLLSCVQKGGERTIEGFEAIIDAVRDPDNM